MENSSSVWLEGARCSPLRLPVAVALFSLRRMALFPRTFLRIVKRPAKKDASILLLLITSFSALYLLLWTLDTQVQLFGTSKQKPHWTLELLKNLIGYSVIIVPGVLVLWFVKGHDEHDEEYCLAPLIRGCFFGNDHVVLGKPQAKQSGNTESDRVRVLKLLGCCFGLQISYLTWGLLQERIMTQKYTNFNGDHGLFQDSQFLVFVNRILAFGIALAYITFFSEKIPRHTAPLYKYAYCSLSNIMSSWCQYEALKFVSFPTQVLAKASKIIPVMAMGKLVMNKTYQTHEYLVAIFISFGMVLFLYGSQDTISSKINANSGQVTTISGFILLTGYMVSDAFTSNWQNNLFTTYKMQPVQAMCGVNLFSCLFTSISLMQQGAFYSSLVFMSQFPKFAVDCIVLSFCSAVGQLFIFATISSFGPVVFVIIMTIRQALAIIISCVTYGHVITAYGVFGVSLVFGATFAKIYIGHRRKQKKTQPQLLVEKLDDSNDSTMDASGNLPPDTCPRTPAHHPTGCPRKICHQDICHPRLLPPKHSARQYFCQLNSCHPNIVPADNSHIP